MPHSSTNSRMPSTVSSPSRSTCGWKGPPAKLLKYFVPRTSPDRIFEATIRFPSTRHPSAASARPSPSSAGAASGFLFLDSWDDYAKNVEYNVWHRIGTFLSSCQPSRGTCHEHESVQSATQNYYIYTDQRIRDCVNTLCK